MKLAAALLLCLGFATLAAAAQPDRPARPDSDYCSRRDADPEKCIIQNGPPNRSIARKPPPENKSKGESRKSKVSKPGTLEK